jgi:hypothetical protein
VSAETSEPKAARVSGRVHVDLTSDEVTCGQCGASVEEVILVRRPAETLTIVVPCGHSVLGRETSATRLVRRATRGWRGEVEGAS